jgi:RNA polymerase sigma-70 factor, ECF subfamily
MTDSGRDAAVEPAWLDGLRRGDPGAREAFAREVLPRVVSRCRRLGGVGIDAEDAAHEVLLIALDKAPRLGPDPRVEAWLFAICRRVLANQRRRAWVQHFRERFVPSEEQAAPGHDPERLLGSKQRVDLARTCLDQLPRGQREVLVLYDLEERGAREVGEMLGIHPEAVRARVMRARKNLRKIAAGLGYPPMEERTSR